MIRELLLAIMKHCLLALVMCRMQTHGMYTLISIILGVSLNFNSQTLQLQLYDWASLSEWKFDKIKWWVLMGQTCAHGTTRYKIEYTFRSKTRLLTGSWKDGSGSLQTRVSAWFWASSVEFKPALTLWRLHNKDNCLSWSEATNQLMLFTHDNKRQNWHVTI